MTKAELAVKLSLAEASVHGLGETNRRQLDRLVGHELLRARVTELERGLADAVTARRNVEVERDQLRAQLDDVLAHVRTLTARQRPEVVR